MSPNTKRRSPLTKTQAATARSSPPFFSSLTFQHPPKDSAPASRTTYKARLAKPARSQREKADCRTTARKQRGQSEETWKGENPVSYSYQFGKSRMNAQESSSDSSEVDVQTN